MGVSSVPRQGVCEHHGGRDSVSAQGSMALVGRILGPGLKDAAYVVTPAPPALGM